MEKKLAKRLKHRRKYKRYAAALAGAAIMAGTSLHGIPVARASAAENPSISPTVATAQTPLIDKDANELIADPDGFATDPATNQNSDKVANKDQRDTNEDARQDKRDKRDSKDDHYKHERYAHERWADRGETLAHRIEWYNDSANKIQIYYSNANAVDIVRAAATDLGFDVNNDSFTLISQIGSQSVVNVFHNGNSYSVTVDQLADGNWIISLVNQIQ